MNSFVVPVSNSNFTAESDFYVFHAAADKITIVCEKFVLTMYGIVVILSIIQTFWKNKQFDRLLASMNETYSDGKFRPTEVSICEHRMRCYLYAERFSHIPNPNRSILFIISTHAQVLTLIALQTLITRRSEIVNDCYSFHYPYDVLKCEDNRDPCQFNETDIAPKCIYYHFEMASLITMVTTIVTWHYSLRYFIIKLIRLIRWVMFRNDDRPRKICCCPPTPRTLKCLMYLQYLYLWIHYIILITIGFLWNQSLFRFTTSILGYTWSPLILAIERISSLSFSFFPEFIQNWLDATSNGALLNVLDSAEVSLVNAKPVVHLDVSIDTTST